jgi:hypothetical protein
MLDIKIPIGLLFSILGIILTIVGAVSYGDTDMYVKSLNININLWSGITMLIFGGLMLYFSKLRKK